MHQEDKLLQALHRRDPAAFAQLFDAYSDKIYRLAVGLLEDENEAEGVVQDAFLRLFERLDGFEGRSSLGTWLYRVSYNLSIDRLRRRRPTLSVDIEADDNEFQGPVILADWRQWPEGVVTESEVADELNRAIRALPEIYRVVFMLREIEGLSTQETAVVADISENLVKVRLHRARLALRESLAESLTERYGV